MIQIINKNNVKINIKYIGLIRDKFTYEVKLNNLIKLGYIIKTYNENSCYYLFKGTNSHLISNFGRLNIIDTKSYIIDYIVNTTLNNRYVEIKDAGYEIKLMRKEHIEYLNNKEREMFYGGTNK